MRVGLTVEELAAEAWSGEPARYAGEACGLRLLEGETVALVGSGSRAVLEQLAAGFGNETAVVDGRAAAGGGVLRVHAVQAARTGASALLVRGPVDDPTVAGPGLAVADLAACPALGLTAVAEVGAPQLAARFADRVAVVADGQVTATYPVLVPRPRGAQDVAHVTDRVRRRLAVS
jgi:hypothetical protein